MRERNRSRSTYVNNPVPCNGLTTRRATTAITATAATSSAGRANDRRPDLTHAATATAATPGAANSAVSGFDAMVRPIPTTSATFATGVRTSTSIGAASNARYIPT
jgi:hypothetical protein